MEWQAVMETPCQENWLIVPIEMGKPPAVKRHGMIVDEEAASSRVSTPTERSAADQEVRPTLTAPDAYLDRR